MAARSQTKRLTGMWAINDEDRGLLSRPTEEEVEEILNLEPASQSEDETSEESAYDDEDGAGSGDGGSRPSRVAHRAAKAGPHSSASPNSTRVDELRRALRRCKVPPADDKLDCFRRTRRVKIFLRFGNLLITNAAVAEASAQLYTVTASAAATPSSSSATAAVLGSEADSEDIDNESSACSGGGDALWRVIDSWVERYAAEAAQAAAEAGGGAGGERRRRGPLTPSAALRAAAGGAISGRGAKASLAALTTNPAGAAAAATAAVAVATMEARGVAQGSAPQRRPAHRLGFPSGADAGIAGGGAAVAQNGGDGSLDAVAASEHNAIWSEFWSFYRRQNVDAPRMSVAMARRMSMAAMEAGSNNDSSSSEEDAAVASRTPRLSVAPTTPRGAAVTAPQTPRGAAVSVATPRGGGASSARRQTRFDAGSGRVEGGTKPSTPASPGRSGAPSPLPSPKGTPAGLKKMSVCSRRASVRKSLGSLLQLSQDVRRPRRTGFAAKLPKLEGSKEASSESGGGRPREGSCFSGYEDYKHHLRILQEAQGSLGLKKEDLYRPGLSLRRLPDEQSARGIPSVQAAARSDELATAVKNLLDTAASTPRAYWTANERELVLSLEHRAKRGASVDVEQSPSPMKMHPPRLRPPPTFRLRWERPLGSSSMPGEESSDGEGAVGLSAMLSAHRRRSSALEDGLEPLRRFANICSEHGVHPHTESVRFLLHLPPKLDMRGVGYGDPDLIALALALPSVADTTRTSLEAVDVGENARLSDASIVELFRSLADDHAGLRILRMDKCPGVGHEALKLCTKLLTTSFKEMQKLDLGGCRVGMREYSDLAVAIRNHPGLTDVRLTETGLGFCESAKIVSSIISNQQLESLDLGWNSLGVGAFEALGRGVVEHRALKSLGLANTSNSAEMISPLLGFIELLAGDGSLTSLDISMNCLSSAALLVTEYSFRQHPRIQRLDVSRNTFGLHGCRALLRLLAHSGCPELCSVKIDDCGCTGAAATISGMELFDQDPSGKYSLDLRHPVQRSLLRLLLASLAERTPNSPPSAFLKNCTLTGANREERFSCDAVKKGKGGMLVVPTSGSLSFDLDLGPALVRPEDAALPPVAAVARIVARRRITIEGHRKVRSVLAHIKSVSDDYVRDNLLEALSYDFILTPEQANSFCMTSLKTRNCAHDPVATCIKILPTVVDPLFARLQVLGTEGLQEIMRMEFGARALLGVCYENAAGHYELGLSEPPERVVAERLLLLSRWQGMRWKAAGLLDISQRSNFKCTRNEMHAQRSYFWGSDNWVLPRGGTFSFDFAPLSRPPASATPLSEEVWNQIVSTVRRHIFPQEVRRMGTFGLEETHIAGDGRRITGKAPIPKPLDKRSMRASASDAMCVLAGLSGHIWITCRQLRRLLVSLRHQDQRRDLLVTFVFRCVDWPLNGKLCRAVFQLGDWKELERRVGFVAMFPFFQPENCHFRFNLAAAEERRCFHALVRLSNQESPGGGNCKAPRIDKGGPSDTQKFEPFTSGIPMMWDSYDAIPTCGVVEVGYACSLDDAKLRARRRAAASLGGWTALPEDVAALTARLSWWKVLYDVPQELVQVAIFLKTTFNSLDEAFAKCDKNGDTKLNHQEFVHGLRALGCLAPPLAHHRGARPPSEEAPTRETPTLSPSPAGSMPGTPAASARGGRNSSKKFEPIQLLQRSLGTEIREIEDVEECLSHVFRFLDPRNRGELTRNEFEVFESLWAELLLSALEFRQYVTDSFSSLESGWRHADKHEEDVISFAVFREMAQEYSFDGPVSGIFMFLDRDRDDALSREEWMQLEGLREDYRVSTAGNRRTPRRQKSAA